MWLTNVLADVVTALRKASSAQEYVYTYEAMWDVVCLHIPNYMTISTKEGSIAGEYLLSAWLLPAY